jgi:hypothetical protein
MRFLDASQVPATIIWEKGIRYEVEDNVKRESKLIDTYRKSEVASTHSSPK